MTLVTVNHLNQTINSRPFHGEEDFWRVRNLLIETYPLTPTGFNWEIRRWDGWRFHRETTDITPIWQERLRLWETEDGHLVGVAHPEGDGTVFLELHPDYRHLQDEMLAWAEKYLATPVIDTAQNRLETFAFEYDTPRQKVLAARGYEKMPYGGVTRRIRFGKHPLPEIVMPEAYTVRGTHDDEDDYRRIADILNAGFNRTMHTALEFKHFATRSPSFQHNLNLVAETPDGIFAALVGATYEPTNRYGIIEPVCTHPDHRRKGLARILILQALHRLQVLGATDVYVDTGDMVAANTLYDEVGFTEAYKGYIWQKFL